MPVRRLEMLFAVRVLLPLLLVSPLAGRPAPAAAQAPLASPSASQGDAGVRGLTPAEIADLREGAGMGLARAAELNGYPGPRHLLDADEAGAIVLTPEQRDAVRRIHGAMTAEARRLGALILEEERGLEAAFRARTIDAAGIEARLGRIAGLQRDLRAVHLLAHLATRPLLTAEQLARYDAVRGHAPPAGAHQHRH